MPGANKAPWRRCTRGNRPGKDTSERTVCQDNRGSRGRDFGPARPPRLQRSDFRPPDGDSMKTPRVCEGRRPANHIPTGNQSERYSCPYGGQGGRRWTRRHACWRRGTSPHSRRRAVAATSDAWTLDPAGREQFTEHGLVELLYVLRPDRSTAISLSMCLSRLGSFRRESCPRCHSPELLWPSFLSGENLLPGPGAQGTSPGNPSGAAANRLDT
jgi:hypothetical protein